MILSIAPLWLCAFQCVDPAPAGFTESLDQVLLLSDGAQTKLDIRRPQNANPCGWPIVILVHGIGGDRHSLSGTATGLAVRGYYAVAYDVRGHGDHTGFNTHTSLRERKDLGEVIAFAAAHAEADGSRIGVSGGSMGGMHAWMAAAWDGAPYEDASGAFPDIDVVVTENISPDFRANLAPQANAVHCTDFNITTGNGVLYDPALQASALAAVLAQDYSTWDAIVAGPSTDPWPRVPSITCPVMAMAAFDDFAFPAGRQAAGCSALPASTPRKLYLGTGGHQSPTNNAEITFRINWRNQWLDHWLKNAANGIETGPNVAYAITPDDTAAYLSATSTWTHRTSDAWPPSAAADTRWYLRAGGSLAPAPPNANEAANSLVQTVVPGFDMQDAVNVGFALALVQANIPRATVAYETSALVSDLEYAGDAKVHLSVSSAQTRWQVRARLLDVPPVGAPRYVAGGSYFAFDDVAVGANTIDVTINANAYVFRAGHKLRLELQNLQVHEPPTGSSLRFGPYPSPFTLDVQHSPAALSWLDLPTLSGMGNVATFCLGDGSLAACPCGNNGAAGHGCASSIFPNGGILHGSGAASVSFDSFLLQVQELSGNVCVFFQGTAQSAPTVIDDGLGCVSGSLIRLGTKSLVGATTSYPQPGDLPVSIKGQIGALGGTRYYQAYYRNAAPMFCPPATTNRTNGVTAIWSR